MRQQPQRARMCGLGDKDRRQISPPPCVQLTIIDKNTGNEISPENVSNASCYMLICELWDPKGVKNLSIVDTLQDSHNSGGGDLNEDDNDSNENNDTENTGNDANSEQGGLLNNCDLDQNIDSTGGSSENLTLVNKLDDPAPTRNLIGNNVTNAFKLYDENNNLGLWFVLQDLSIRIEGKFKLKFLLFKLNPATIFESAGANEQEAAAGGSDSNAGGKSIPILDYKFSDVFQVYSAKKFPGVMDSTPLSKAFAGQGVKIPIRRDKKGAN